MTKLRINAILRARSPLLLRNQMELNLVETILVRELKPADRYKYVGRWIYRGIMDEIGKATSGQPGQEAATESLNPVLLSSSGNEAPSAKVV